MNPSTQQIATQQFAAKLPNAKCGGYRCYLGVPPSHRYRRAAYERRGASPRNP